MFAGYRARTARASKKLADNPFLGGVFGENSVVSA